MSRLLRAAAVLGGIVLVAAVVPGAASVMVAVATAIAITLAIRWFFTPTGKTRYWL